ncbi:MAG: hypothetical protein U0360_06850 [Dehalococcoidia bacterium]
MVLAPGTHRVPRFLWAAILVLSVIATACRPVVAQPRQSSGFMPIPRITAGEPRSFLLGFSGLPAEPSVEGYVAAMDLAANYGEVLLIQRAPSWDSFLNNRVSTELERRTLAERQALTERNLRLAYALDVFDPSSRGRLADLPPEYEGRTLADPALRRALVQNARFVALNYRPAFLILGVEVNATFESNPEAYAAFLEAYTEAYNEVKAAAPTTLVFPSFQYEELMGVVPWEALHAPRWRLLEDFASRMDLFGITSYPSFVFQAARKIPAEYYTDAKAHVSVPIAFTAVGFASGQTREGLNSSTPAEQRRYLLRVLGDADALSSPLLIWFAGRDPARADSPPLDLIASIGLRTADDVAKDGWAAWEQAVNRPYAGTLVPEGRR